MVLWCNLLRALIFSWQKFLNFTVGYGDFHDILFSSGLSKMNLINLDNANEMNMLKLQHGFYCMYN